MSEWYETFFDALAFDVWRALVPVEVSEAEAQFIHRRFAGADRLLDVPCGDGRLSFPVAALGHRVVGVDLAEAGLERLRRDGGSSSTVTARRGDMRDLRAAIGDLPPFDGAWCMGNSFGYLSTPDTGRFLEGLAASLRSGAGFLLDAAVAAELVLPHPGTSDRYEGGGAVLASEHTYDAIRSTVVTEMTLEYAGRRDVRTVGHRVLTVREIVESLEAAGFAVDDVLGGLDGEPFTLGAERCLVLATRA